MNEDKTIPDFTLARETRRSFLKKTLAASVALAGASALDYAAETPPGAGAAAASAGTLPWYRRAIRWGQTNIAEIDPTRYDIPWWREQWKRTRTQGIVVNAGGIVAFYPTQVPMQRKAEYLGTRDMFGELCAAAKEDGLVVFARMDSNGAHEEFYQAHPDWFARQANGRPYTSRDLYVTCVNGPYYVEHIPAILREVATRYHPAGFTDNSWSGLQRSSICYCENCQKKFRDKTGQELPAGRNWNDPVYRQWIMWGYARRVEIWDEFNRITKAAGGPDCIWVGMNGGTITAQSLDFRDYREICQRAEMIMLDHQRRDNATGFQSNGGAGKLVHGMLGWDKVIPESMAMYQLGAPLFRLGSKPEPEVRMWMVDGFAGGIQPWWHFVNAYHEDRRMYHTPVQLGQWHEANEPYLMNRLPVATVGVLWSQRNNDFFGREEADLMVNLPQRGMTEALMRARIPYLMVNLDDLDRDAAQLKLVVLPNVGAMTDAQVAAVRRFVERGGGLVASGQSSLGDEWGDARADFALGDLYGVHAPENFGGRNEGTRRGWATEAAQSYLRLTPELRARVDGPHIPGEPAITGERHPVLKGFDETDILGYGGTLTPLTLDSGTQVLLTFIPSFPAYPPENAWMRTPKTDLPGLVLNEKPGRGRVAYLAADLDRRYARENMPDNGNLLGNLLRWAAQGDVPLTVEGPGLLDCYLYKQPGRAILHLVNLTSAGTWRSPVDELISVGPARVGVRLPEGVRGGSVRLLVSGEKPAVTVRNGWASFEVKAILDHEVAVIEG